VAFGAANDKLLSFSTPGPDKYADGTVVKDGECYALVWTKKGVTFAGFTADGKAVGADSKVIAYVPVAKGGRCPTVVFEIDADLAETLAGGEYSIYMLDTRLADGRVGVLNADGVPLALNGYGAIVSSDEEKADGSPSSISGASVQQMTKSALPADLPKPKIVAMKIAGANVILTVKGTVPYLQYATKSRGADGAETEVKVDQGSADGDTTTVVVPMKGNSGLFSIEQK